MDAGARLGGWTFFPGTVHAFTGAAAKNSPQQLLLRSGHFFREARLRVVVAAQVEQAVEAVEERFVVEGEAVLGGLVPRDGGADEDFAVGEGDDVGLGRIAKKFRVHPGHRRAVDQHEADFAEPGRKRARKQAQRGLKLPPKWTNRHRHLVLLV